MARIKIIWSATAREDLREIREFIARDKPRAAQAYTNKIREKVKQLREFPQLGATVAEVDDPEFRELIHGPYRIIYRYRAGEIRILTVRHGARRFDPKKLME